MSHHAYIDEAGTLPEHDVMTVALVVLDGSKAASKLHTKVAKAVFTPPKTRGLAEKERWYANQNLHFVDMNAQQRAAASSVLATANVRAIIGHHKHTSLSTNHDYRFAIYKELLRVTIAGALTIYEDLTVFISKQGGWESYGPDLLREIKDVPRNLRQPGFRTAEFFLASPAKPGQQIADFFASSSRHHLLNRDQAMSASYEGIRHRVIHIEEVNVTAELIKEK